MPVHNKRRNPPADAIYIGRGSRWGNPYRIGQDGDRYEVIAKYRLHLWEQVKAGEVTTEDLAALHDRDLVCYCAPAPCHGDVLLRAAAWATTRQEVGNA